MTAMSKWVVSGSAARAWCICCLVIATAISGCTEEAPPAGSGGSGACMVPTAGMAAPVMLGGVPGCEAAVAGTPTELHEAAKNVLNAAGTCSFGSCHTPDQHKANLVLLGAPDMRTLLVNKASCQAPILPLVKEGCGDDALLNSWLWIKLVAPADASGVLATDPVWGTPGEPCDKPGGQPFGIRMPWGSGNMVTSEARLAPIRNWICAGAPGPQ
jgi:hypothetical protein